MGSWAGESLRSPGSLVAPVRVTQGSEFQGPFSGPGKEFFNNISLLYD